MLSIAEETIGLRDKSFAKNKSSISSSSIAMIRRNEIILGDALTVLKTLPDSWCDCTITSPPYFSKAYRYTTNTLPNQIGVERNPTDYIKSLMKVCNEIKRILKPTGTFWINIGDTYADKRLQGIPDTFKDSND